MIDYFKAGQYSVKHILDSLHPLGSLVVDPGTCSSRLCTYKTSWTLSIWLTEKEGEGCDCCLLSTGAPPNSPLPPKTSLSSSFFPSPSFLPHPSPTVPSPPPSTLLSDRVIIVTSTGLYYYSAQSFSHLRLTPVQ